MDLLWSGMERKKFLFLFLWLLWILLNGRADWEIVLTGAACSAALSWAADRALHLAPRTELRLLRKLPGVLCYLVYLAGQVLVSNLRVMGRILRPGKATAPRLVTFRAPLSTRAGRLALANSITLTPGTIAAALREDGTMTVYALDGMMAEGLEDSGLTRRLRRLEGARHD